MILNISIKKTIKIKKMSFSETIPEDEILQDIYEKMIFNEFHKKTKQLKQETIKGTCLSKSRITFKVASTTVSWE